MTPSPKRVEADPEEMAALEKAGVRVMLNEAQVLKIVPVATVTLWRMVKRGEFPPPSFIAAARKVWYLDEIRRWQSEIEQCGRGRRKRPARRSNSAKT